MTMYKNISSYANQQLSFLRALLSNEKCLLCYTNTYTLIYEWNTNQLTANFHHCF